MLLTEPTNREVDWSPLGLVQIPSPPFISCVTLGKWLHLSEPWLPPL